VGRSEGREEAGRKKRRGAVVSLQLRGRGRKAKSRKTRSVIVGGSGGRMSTVREKIDETKRKRESERMREKRGKERKSRGKNRERTRESKGIEKERRTRPTEIRAQERAKGMSELA